MEACSPSGSENQGVGTTNPTGRVSETTIPTAGGSEVALSKPETVCKNQGVVARVAGEEDQEVCANALRNFGKKRNLIWSAKWDL